MVKPSGGKSFRWGRPGGEADTFAAERPLDSGELHHLVQRLLLLAVLAGGDDAVQLLVVLAARLAAELVHLVLVQRHFQSFPL